MEPIISNWIIYLIEIVSNLYYGLAFIFGIGIILLCIALIVAIGHIIVNGMDTEEILEWFTKYKSISFKVIYAFLFLLLISCFVPSQETMYLMLVNSFITPDNLSFVDGEVKDLIDYTMQQINMIVNGNN